MSGCPNAKLASLFDGAVIKLDWEVNQTVRDGSLYVGGKIAGEHNVSYLAHEMAHFVEINDARCWRYGWGLVYRQVPIMGRMYDEPLTTDDVERECRVAAIQINLLEWAGVTVTAESIVSSFHFLSGFWWIPRKTDAERTQWCAALVRRLELRHEHQIDEVLTEWHRKQGVLQRAMDLGYLPRRKVKS